MIFFSESRTKILHWYDQRKFFDVTNDLRAYDNIRIISPDQGDEY